MCDATSVRTCRYFAQPCFLLWELLLVWVGPLLRGWPYISQSNCNEVRDPGYCNGSLHPILVFHKRNKLSSKFLLHIKLGSDRSHTFRCFIFSAVHVCMSICYHYQLWWERTTVNICSICSDSSCIFFAPFWHTTFAQSQTICIGSIGRVGSIDNIGSIKQSR